MKTELEYDDGLMHDSVQIAGDFSGWEGLDMEYTGIGTLYKREIDFDSNRWMYKFIVDGQWVLKEGLPTATLDDTGIVNHLFECHDNVNLDIDKDIAHVFQKTRSHSYHSSALSEVEGLEEDHGVEDSALVTDDDDDEGVPVERVDSHERGLVCGEECRRLSDEKAPFKSSYGLESAIHHHHLYSDDDRSLSHISEGSQTPLGDSSASPAPFTETEEKKPYEQSRLRTALSTEQMKAAAEQLNAKDEDFEGDSTVLNTRFDHVAPLKVQSKNGISPHHTPDSADEGDTPTIGEGDKFVASEFGTTAVAPSFANEPVKDTPIVDPTQLYKQQAYTDRDLFESAKYDSEDRYDSDDRYVSARESTDEIYDSDQVVKPEQNFTGQDFTGQAIKLGGLDQPIEQSEQSSQYQSATQLAAANTVESQTPVKELPPVISVGSQLPTKEPLEPQLPTQEADYQTSPQDEPYLRDVNEPPLPTHGATGIQKAAQATNVSQVLSGVIDETPSSTNGFDEPRLSSNGFNKPQPSFTGTNKPQVSSQVNEPRPSSKGINKPKPSSEEINEPQPPSREISEPQPPSDANESQPPSKAIKINESQGPSKGINDVEPQLSSKEISRNEIPSQVNESEPTKGINVVSYPPENVVDKASAASTAANKAFQSPGKSEKEFSNVSQISESISPSKNKLSSVPGLTVNGQYLHDEDTEGQVNGEKVEATAAPAGSELGLGGAVTAATAATAAAVTAAAASTATDSQATPNEKESPAQSSGVKDNIINAAKAAKDKAKSNSTADKPSTQTSTFREDITSAIKAAGDKVTETNEDASTSEVTESPTKASQVAAARKDARLEERPQDFTESATAVSGASRAFISAPNQQGQTAQELSNKSSDLTAHDETSQVNYDAQQQDLSHKASQATTMTVDELRDAISTGEHPAPVTDYDHKAEAPAHIATEAPKQSVEVAKPSIDTDKVKRSPSSGRRIEVPNQTLRDQIHHTDKKGKRPGFFKRLLTKMKS